MGASCAGCGEVGKRRRCRRVRHGRQSRVGACRPRPSSVQRSRRLQALQVNVDRADAQDARGRRQLHGQSQLDARCHTGASRYSRHASRTGSAEGRVAGAASAGCSRILFLPDPDGSERGAPRHHQYLQGSDASRILLHICPDL
ncbi:hypothetical protein D3C76_1347070 [compost metagenome]